MRRATWAPTKSPWHTDQQPSAAVSCWSANLTQLIHGCRFWKPNFGEACENRSRAVMISSQPMGTSWALPTALSVFSEDLCSLMFQWCQTLSDCWSAVRPRQLQLQQQVCSMQVVCGCDTFSSTGWWASTALLHMNSVAFWSWGLLVKLRCSPLVIVDQNRLNHSVSGLFCQWWLMKLTVDIDEESAGETDNLCTWSFPWLKFEWCPYLRSDTVWNWTAELCDVV